MPLEPETSLVDIQNINVRILVVCGLILSAVDVTRTAHYKQCTNLTCKDSHRQLVVGVMIAPVTLGAVTVSTLDPELQGVWVRILL